MTGLRTNSVHARPRSASPGEHPPHRETSRACDSNAGAARDDGHRRARERPSRLPLGRARSGLVTSPYRLDTLPDRNWAAVPDFVLTCVFARPYSKEASAGATEVLELWLLLTRNERPSRFAASRCRNLQLARVAVTAPGPARDLWQLGAGAATYWEVPTPWHQDQVASRVYERVAT